MDRTEAGAVNGLLGWLLDPQQRVPSDDARRSAEFLAGRAYTILGTGLRAEHVRQAWPLRREPVGDHRAHREQILDQVRPPLTNVERDRVRAILEAADRTARP